MIEETLLIGRWLFNSTGLWAIFAMTCYVLLYVGPSIMRWARGGYWGPSRLGPARLVKLETPRGKEETLDRRWRKP